MDGFGVTVMFTSYAEFNGIRDGGRDHARIWLTCIVVTMRRSGAAPVRQVWLGVTVRF